MPDQATARSSKRLDRRAKIIEIARECFREHGLAETRLDLIADEAEIARPNLYRYFKDKSELVSAVLVEEARAINAFRLQKLEGLVSFSDRVVRSFQATVEILDADSLWADIVSPAHVPYTAYIASSDPLVLQSNYDYWTPILEAAEHAGELNPSLDKQEVMKWLLGLEFMFMERKEIFPTLDDVEHYARAFVLPALTP